MFYHPWFLLFLVFVPVIGWRLWGGRQRSSITFSSAVERWDVRPTWRQRISWLPGVLTLAALTLMVVSLARPRLGREQTIINSEGIALEMVVDRSGSMRALDFTIDGQHVDRLTAIKSVARKFVLGDDTDGEAELLGRVSDLVGLVTFAGYADAITPPTLDHAFLVAQLARTQIVTTRREDGTAIGDAISLAVDKLSSLDARRKEKINSKVIILLTDGENTAGEIEPLRAAELAAAMDIKIYTIGVGTKGQAPFPVRRTLDGRILYRNVDVNIDEKTLRQIADATGGNYFRATDTESLQAIYEEIDRMEKTNVETQRLVDYRELAVQPARIGGYRIPALLLVAFFLLAARLILNHTIFRQLM